MSLPSFRLFLKEHTHSKISAASYVTHPGFSSLYVHVGSKYINYILTPRVVTFANVRATQPGAGVFSELVVNLHGGSWRAGFAVYVECVHNERFAAKLERMGFRHQPDIQGAPSLYLLTNMPLLEDSR